MKGDSNLLNSHCFIKNTFCKIEKEVFGFINVGGVPVCARTVGYMYCINWEKSQEKAIFIYLLMNSTDFVCLIQGCGRWTLKSKQFSFIWGKFAGNHFSESSRLWHFYQPLNLKTFYPYLNHTMVGVAKN